MIYDKKRLALLAGIDSRDQYFGQTLRESSLWEAEDDLDAAEDEEEAPLEAEGGEEEVAEEEAGNEEAVPKEEIVDALAPMLGIDAAELSALVSGEEEGAEEEGAEEEGAEDLDLELESDVLVVDASEEGISVHEARLRKAIRGEIKKVISEVMIKRDMEQISYAHRTKSISAIMGYKAARPSFTSSRPSGQKPTGSSRRMRTGKGFKK